MKTKLKVVILLLSCFAGFNAFSQSNKVKYDKDTIKIDGEFYAIMKKKSVGLFINEFSVRNHDNVELIYLKYKTRPRWVNGVSSSEGYYEFNFIGSGSNVNIYNLIGANNIAKFLIENNLIKNDAIDYDAERRFIQINHGYTPKNESSNSNQPTIIINNGGSSAPNNDVKAAAPVKSNAKFTIDGNKILRDGNLVGKFRLDTTNSSYSQKLIFITVYSDGGDKIAEASAPASNPAEWSIKTFSDDKTSTILYDSPGEKERLFKWLSDKGYLQ